MLQLPTFQLKTVRVVKKPTGHETARAVFACSVQGLDQYLVSGIWSQHCNVSTCQIIAVSSVTSIKCP